MSLSNIQLPRKYVDILCIGEIGSGKTSFLKEYTGQQDDDEQSYKIFTKRLDDIVVFFHEIEQQQQVYIDQPYNGILFFIDIIHSVRAQSLILTWLDYYSKVTGNNIFKIPIKVVAMKGDLLMKSQMILEKNRIQRELAYILKPQQITYWTHNSKKSSEQLKKFFNKLYHHETEDLGLLNNNYYIVLRTFGIIEFFKTFFRQLKFNWLRRQRLTHILQNKQ